MKSSLNIARSSNTFEKVYIIQDIINKLANVIACKNDLIDELWRQIKSIIDESFFSIHSALINYIEKLSSCIVFKNRTLLVLPSIVDVKLSTRQGSEGNMVVEVILSDIYGRQYTIEIRDQFPLNKLINSSLIWL